MTPPRTMALDGGAERDAGMLRARLTATDLANEVAERELEGLWARAWDAAALLMERSEEIGALEASGYAGRKEIWAMEATPLRGGGLAPRVEAGTGGGPLR